MHSYRLANENDNERILKLVNSTPQQGIVTLSFERSPNYFFGSGVSSQQYNVVVAENTETKQIDGVASLGTRKVYVNGAIRTVGYAFDLRISEQMRGGRLLFNIYRKSRVYLDNNDFTQSVILEENQKSIRTVAAGRCGMPHYYPYGKLTTYIVSTAFDFASTSKLTIRRAAASDVEEFQAFFDREAPKKQFYPAYEFNQVGKNPYYRDIRIKDYYLAISNNNIIGMCGVWQQKNFKQTKIVNYPRWMSYTRPLYNLWCKLFGGFPLPVKGKIANYVSLHTILVKDNESLILKDLLKHIRKDLAKNNEKTMIIGLCLGDPLRQALRGFVYRKMHSLHFLLGYGPDCRDKLNKALPVYLEVARL